MNLLKIAAAIVVTPIFAISGYYLYQGFKLDKDLKELNKMKIFVIDLLFLKCKIILDLYNSRLNYCGVLDNDKRNFYYFCRYGSHGRLNCNEFY